MQCPYCKEEVLEGALKCKHCGSTLGSIPGQTLSGGGDFGELFTGAMNIWKSNLADFAILTLVFMLVVWIPIANIGFIAGYVRSLMKVARGQGRAQVGDLFNSWDCFGNLLVYFIISFIAMIVLNFIPVLGQLASLVLGFAIAPGIYAIIDNKRSAVDALKWSIESVKTYPIPWLLAYLVGNIITCAGLIVLLVGVVLTASLGTLINISQYERVKPA
ncbi:MAG TPA: zinc ribbon domain-containing protein [Desulfuromonadales bacterium]|nr:zinc ribbon domain-containing protein [Desulfuromonadales bacterium]